MREGLSFIAGGFDCATVAAPAASARELAINFLRVDGFISYKNKSRVSKNLKVASL